MYRVVGKVSLHQASGPCVDVIAIEFLGEATVNVELAHIDMRICITTHHTWPQFSVLPGSKFIEQLFQLS